VKGRKPLWAWIRRIRGEWEEKKGGGLNARKQKCLNSLIANALSNCAPQDGFQTTQKIRTDPELASFKSVPIIAVTASEADGDRARAKEVGMDDFTLKPLDNEYLKLLLQMALKKGQERAENEAKEKAAAHVAVQSRPSTSPAPRNSASRASEVNSGSASITGPENPATAMAGGSGTGKNASIKSEDAMSARSARTQQLMPAEGDVPGLTFTSATPVISRE